MAEKAHKYLSARIGSQWYGIEVEKVIEVLHLVAYTEAPALQNDILGLTTVRDEVMPLIDLRRRFGLKDAQLKLDTPVVAIREAHGLIALVFDDADSVEDVYDAQLRRPWRFAAFSHFRAVAQYAGRFAAAGGYGSNQEVMLHLSASL